MGIKQLLRILYFSLIFFLLLANSQMLFQDKWVSLSNSYARVRQFYQEEQRPEVVFIGSSHVHYNINPLQIFDEYGITSYDFASPDQDFSASRLYIEESIRMGPPKVIVLEVLNMTRFVNSEVRHRQCLDQLPLSLNKLKYLLYSFERNKLHKSDVKYDSVVSYLFPTLRYHDRWDKLTKNDLDWDPEIPYYHGATHYHGYGPHYYTVEADFSGYDEPIAFDDSILEENEKIFSDIVAMCEQSGVELLLLKTPSPSWRRDKHDLVQRWAEKYHIPFLDYKDFLEEIGIDATTDFMDKSHHLNDNGVTKVSRHLGKYLQEKYQLPDHRGDSRYAVWETDYQIYEQDKASYFLSHETDWSRYLEKLKDPNYTIYVAAKDNLGGVLHPELAKQLCLIREDRGVTIEGKTHSSYLLVIDKGEVIYEKISDQAISYESETGKHRVEMESAHFKAGNKASIKIDYKEYFVDRRGIGIVVYDNILEDVVDCVTFDIHGGGTAYR